MLLIRETRYPRQAEPGRRLHMTIAARSGELADAITGAPSRLSTRFSLHVTELTLGHPTSRANSGTYG